MAYVVTLSRDDGSQTDRRFFVCTESEHRARNLVHLTGAVGRPDRLIVAPASDEALRIYRKVPRDRCTFMGER
ncbi:MAG TPA: hypothetical protein VGI20_08810 [Rhizomicrobium sp.]|jgi:hypothetical protein